MKTNITKNQRLLSLIFYILQIIYLPSCFGDAHLLIDIDTVKSTNNNIDSEVLIFKKPGDQALIITNHLQQDISVGDLFFIGDEATAPSIAQDISIQGAAGCSIVKAGAQCTMIINAAENTKLTTNPNGLQLLLNYMVDGEEKNRFAPLRLKIEHNKKSEIKTITSMLAGISTWGAIKGAYSQQIEALITPIFVTIIGNNQATDIATKTATAMFAGFSYAVDDKNLNYFDNEFNDNNVINKAIHYGTMHLSLNLYRCYKSGLMVGTKFLHGNNGRLGSFNSIAAIGAGILTSSGCLVFAVGTGLAATFGTPLLNEMIHANILQLPATTSLFTSAAIRTTLRSMLSIPNGGLTEIYQDTISGGILDWLNFLSTEKPNNTTALRPISLHNIICNHKGESCSSQ